MSFSLDDVLNLPLYNSFSSARNTFVNVGVVITELQKRGGLDEEKYAAFLEHSRHRLLFIDDVSGSLIL